MAWIVEATLPALRNICYITALIQTSAAFSSYKCFDAVYHVIIYLYNYIIIIYNYIIKYSESVMIKFPYRNYFLFAEVSRHLK
jgi:hypothetical protein